MAILASYPGFVAATGIERRDRLARARLYLCLEARPHGRDPGSLLAAALRGGVDVVQLRDKEAGDAEILAAATVFRRLCDEHGALFVLNDRPDLAVRVAADGVHVGQEDMPVAAARAIAGPELLIGLSTHAPAELDATEGTDYVAVGPVWATPTKEGRPRRRARLRPLCRRTRARAVVRDRGHRPRAGPRGRRRRRNKALRPARDPRRR